MRAARNVRLFPGKYASDCVFTASTRPHAHLPSLKGTPQNWPGRRCAFDFGSNGYFGMGTPHPTWARKIRSGTRRRTALARDRHTDSANNGSHPEESITVRHDRSLRPSCDIRLIEVGVANPLGLIGRTPTPEPAWVSLFATCRPGPLPLRHGRSHGLRVRGMAC